MKYQTHTNPLEVYCADCDREITLECQYADPDGKIRCEECNLLAGNDEDDENQ